MSNHCNKFPMRLLYVTDALAIWGGLERILAEKMSYLAEKYHYDIRLVTINQGAHPLPYPLHPSITHRDLRVNLHHKYLYRGLKRALITIKLEALYIRRLRREIKKNKPDVVILMRYEHWEVYFCTQGLPLVVESHSMCICNLFGDCTFLQRSWVNLSKYLSKRANRLVTLTEGDASDWAHYTNKIQVIPNVVHLNEEGTFTNQTAKSVVFAGRIAPQKDVFTLLRIWELVHRRHPEWMLNIFGEGEQEDALCQEVKVMNANICLHAPSKFIMERFKENSILVVTSEFEPFGLVIPEAMSCGLPVVSFDCPYGPADIITDGVDGFLIKDRDIGAFADRVCLLIEDEALRMRMGQNGILSSQRYRAEIIMPKWVKLFEELAST